MSEMKHEPGWKIADIHAHGIFDTDGSVTVHTDDAERRPIATVLAQAPVKRGRGAALRDLERDRHAHLIAAAPEMYEALFMSNWRLSNLLALLPAGRPERDEIERDMAVNRAALAKAEGRS